MKEMNEYDMETQCFICPHCFDDHAPDHECAEKKLSEYVRLQGTIDENLMGILLDAIALIEPRAEDFVDSHSGCIVRGNDAAKEWLVRVREALAET